MLNNGSRYKKTGQNRYCKQCQREVVDFTKMSQKEVADYFTNATGSVCGRLAASQQKTYQVTNSFSVKPLISSLITASSLLFTGTTIYGQEKDAVEQSAIKVTPKDTSPSKRMVSGKVTDENGESIPGVKVRVKETQKTVSTDLDGNFSLKAKPGQTLIFSFVGFETKELPIHSEKMEDIVITVSYDLLGEVVFVRPRFTPRNIWQATKRFFQQLF